VIFFVCDRGAGAARDAEIPEEGKVRYRLGEREAASDEEARRSEESFSSDR